MVTTLVYTLVGVAVILFSSLIFIKEDNEGI